MLCLSPEVSSSPSFQVKIVPGKLGWSYATGYVCVFFWIPPNTVDMIIHSPFQNGVQSQNNVSGFTVASIAYCILPMFAQKRGGRHGIGTSRRRRWTASGSCLARHPRKREREGFSVQSASSPFLCQDSWSCNEVKYWVALLIPASSRTHAVHPVQL